jgi:putative membrane protein
VIDYEGKSWAKVLGKVRGTVFRAVLARVVVTAVLGEVAVYLFENRGLRFSPVAHTMVGVALGLLLVFRTNASYDRYWEGRRLLGGIVNRTRDLARQIRGYFPAERRAVGAEIVRLLNAYFALAMQGLRGETDLDVHGDRLTAEEKVRLTPCATRATMVLAWITSRLDRLARDGVLDEAHLRVMDQNLTALVDYYSGCERIVRTPVPFAYAHHIKIFVSLFCFTVPFAIVDAMKVWTPLAAAILAFALFGIDEIGVEIEDPFGYDDNDLPIDRIAKTIETGMRDVTEG